jgi:hypothetical protein
MKVVGSYRFDDPDGEVGIETLLLKGPDGPTLQVALTYRAAPLSGAESYLIGTTDHSVLGERWVYDGCGDVVYVTALATTILNGGHEAALDVVTDEGLVRREATTKVTGSGANSTDVRILESITTESLGTETHVTTGEYEIVLYRVVEDIVADDARSTLRGTWPGQESPVVLASLLKK